METAEEIRKFIDDHSKDIMEEGQIYLIEKTKKFLKYSDPSTRHIKFMVYFMAEQYFSKYESDTVPFEFLAMDSYTVGQHYDKNVFLKETNGLKLTILRSEFLKIAKLALKSRIKISKLTALLL